MFRTWQRSGTSTLTARCSSVRPYLQHVTWSSFATPKINNQQNCSWMPVHLYKDRNSWAPRKQLEARFNWIEHEKGLGKIAVMGGNKSSTIIMITIRWSYWIRIYRYIGLWKLTSTHPPSFRTAMFFFIVVALHSNFASVISYCRSLLLWSKHPHCHCSLCLYRNVCVF